MKKLKNELTPKQKQLQVRKRLLIAFRRFVSLKSGGSCVRQYLDLNAIELRNYFESKWLPGMTWDNYKSFWVVDHLVGLCHFNAFDDKEMSLCWSHVNLLPVYLYDNLVKTYHPETADRIFAKRPQSHAVKQLRLKLREVILKFEVYYQPGEPVRRLNVA